MRREPLGCKVESELGGERSLDLLETEDGARLVEQILGRIAHGVFSRAVFHRIPQSTAGGLSRVRGGYPRWSSGSADSSHRPSGRMGSPGRLPELRRIGERWAERQETAVLSVPSAIIPEERNYLINPRHEESDEIRAHHQWPFDFDPPSPSKQPETRTISVRSS